MIPSPDNSENLTPASGDPVALLENKPGHVLTSTGDYTILLVPKTAK
jgi:hypothetical protein